VTEPRFVVTVWQPIGERVPSFHVYDKTIRGQVCGRWYTREAAQDHADWCNIQDQETRTRLRPHAGNGSGRGSTGGRGGSGTPGGS
jgi:hypothetical protein